MDHPLTTEEWKELEGKPASEISLYWMIRIFDTIRDRERELQGHRKALSAIATAIDPVGPITPEEILAAIISDREVRRERDELQRKLEECERRLNGEKP
jgi:hypothetical protein